MSLEKAREVFAALDGLSEVAVVNDLRLLSVRAAATHDWTATAAAAAQQAWWFDAVRADDDAANIRRMLDAVMAAGLGDAERTAWTVLGDRDVPLVAERAVLQALEHVIALRSRIWDPRLEALVPGAEALRGFWTAVAPRLPAAVDLPGSGTVAERIASQQQRAAQALVPPEVQAARAVLAATPQRGLVLRVLWHHAATAAVEVRAHAETIATRARDPARRSDYLELARRCAELAAAAGVAR